MIYMYLFYDILDGIKHYTGQQEQFLILLSPFWDQAVAKKNRTTAYG